MRLVIDARYKSTCAVIAIGKSSSALNGTKSVARKTSSDSSHHRQFMMAVGKGAAMPGDMLQHRHNAAIHQPLRLRARQSDHLLGLMAESAVADDVMRAFHRNIGQRRAIDRDAELI